LPLTRFVEDMRQEQGSDKYVPDFDPLDGGIRAQCLFVLEAPGPKTKNSGFVSRDNNDETAKNFLECNGKAGLSREKTIIWNIVPWYIGTGKKIRPANSSDIKTGVLHLHRLIQLLPELQIIVLIGRNAQLVREEIESRYNDFELFCCPHPSPLFVNRKDGNKQKIIDRLIKVRITLDRLNMK